MAPSDRSEPSRRNLVEAASRLISDRGIQAVRVREIAANAGMSPGSVLYHYPENGKLMLAVHRAVVDDYLTLRRATMATEPDPRRKLAQIVRAGVPPYAPTETIRLLYEMHGLARQSDAHAELMTHLWNEETELYVSIIEEGVEQGLFTPQHPTSELAATLLGLEDGLALHITSNNSAVTADLSIQLFLNLAATLLGCDELAEKSSRE